MKQGSVDTLLDFATASSYAGLPPAARNAAQTFLTDAISVGIAGSREPTAAAIRKSVADWGTGYNASILGVGERLPVPSAAFVNSFQVHCQEFDPLHERATVHAMAVLSGALLGVAEDRDLDGETLIHGVALGVEIAVTLGLAAREGLRFFRPATAGALGSVVALSRILGLDRTQCLDAFGLAYSQLAGTMQAHVEGSVALPVQIAHAARATVTAIDLAGAGIGGPHDVLDGPFGYFTLFERDGSLEGLRDELGTVWRVTELSHKPFPTGRAAHAMLDATRTLKSQHGFTVDDVRSIVVTVPPLISRLVARPAVAGMTVNYARLCLRFLLANLLLDGRIDSTTLSESRRNDAGLVSFGDRVEFNEDDTHGVDVLSPQSIRIDLNDGRSLSRAVPETLGSPGNPLDDEGKRSKFSGCLEGTGVDADRLWQALTDVSDCASARELLKLTVPA